MQYYCTTQKKDIILLTPGMDASSLEDLTRQTIPKRIICTESRAGRCFEFANCPLNNKR